MIGGGCLAGRLLDALGPVPPTWRVRELCESLCACLERGSLFEPGGVRVSRAVHGKGDVETASG
jgi:hypothetical protein